MIRVLIVEDVSPMAEILISILRNQTDIEVIGTYTTFHQAQPAIDNADVVIASTSLPEGGAYQLARASSRSDIKGGVLLIGWSEAPEEILQCFEAGARGYFHRDDPVEDLLFNIRSIFRGEAVIGPELGSKVIARLAELSGMWESFQPLPGKLACLTPREREILYLIARDFTNKEISDYLIIEVGTVKNHVHSILSKLNIRSRREATRFLPELLATRKSDLLFHIPQTAPNTHQFFSG